MRLYLINPSNPLVSIVHVKESRWNRYRVWPQVLEDVKHGRLKHRYDGGIADIDEVPLARHDLLSGEYALGAIQTTHGCSFIAAGTGHIWHLLWHKQRG